MNPQNYRRLGRAYDIARAYTNNIGQTASFQRANTRLWNTTDNPQSYTRQLMAIRNRQYSQEVYRGLRSANGSRG